MTEQSREFRVLWQREGRVPTTRIYQTEAGARRKIDGILALEEVKPDTRWADMPDLVVSPTLEVRDVTPWRAAELAAATTPSEAARKGVEIWAGVGDDDAAWAL